MRTSYILLILTVSCLPSQASALSLSVILQATTSALKFITTIVDVFTTSKEEKQLEHLTKEMSSLKQNLKTELNSLLATLHENSYRTLITVHRDKIESCEKDYVNYVAYPSDAAASDNLKKCSNTGVMNSVRILGNYLSGTAIIGSPPLFELYKENGVCNGSAIDSIFKYIFADLVVGCTIEITVEQIENRSNTRFRANECKTIMSAVIDYVQLLYKSCASSSCKTFHNRVRKLFINSPPASSEDLYEKLSVKYPWFNFLIFGVRKGGKATAGGNFSVVHDDGHWTNGYEYVILLFDANLQITRERQMYLLIIEVHVEFYVDHYLGNTTMTESFAAGSTFKTFEGFSSQNNMMCTARNSVNVAYRPIPSYPDRGDNKGGPIVWQETREEGNASKMNTLFPQLYLYCFTLVIIFLLN